MGPPTNTIRSNASQLASSGLNLPRCFAKPSCESAVCSPAPRKMPKKNEVFFFLAITGNKNVVIRKFVADFGGEKSWAASVDGVRRGVRHLVAKPLQEKQSIATQNHIIQNISAVAMKVPQIPISGSFSGPVTVDLEKTFE